MVIIWELITICRRSFAASFLASGRSDGLASLCYHPPIPMEFARDRATIWGCPHLKEPQWLARSASGGWFPPCYWAHSRWVSLPVAACTRTRRSITTRNTTPRSMRSGTRCCSGAQWCSSSSKSRSSIPSSVSVGVLAAEPEAGARQHDAGNHVDRDSGGHPRSSSRADGADDLQDAGQGRARRAAGGSDRPSVVVGVPLPGVRHHDRQRALSPERPPGELRAQDGRRAALVLDSAARRQARPDLEQDQLPLVHADADLPSSAFNGICNEYCGVTREHEVPRVHRDAGGVRPVGGAPEAARGVPGAASAARRPRHGRRAARR